MTRQYTNPTHETPVEPKLPRPSVPFDKEFMHLIGGGDFGDTRDDVAAIDSIPSVPEAPIGGGSPERAHRGWTSRRG